MYCNFCGKQNSDNNAFCQYCGKQLSNVPEPPVSSQADGAIAPNPAAAKKETSGGYCRDCGQFNQSLNENGRCGNCQRTYEEQESAAAFEREDRMGAGQRRKSRLERSPLPTKWFNFYLYVFLLLGSILSIVGLITELSPSNMASFVSLSGGLYLFIGLCYLLDAAKVFFLIFTFVQMLRLKKSGYLANRVLLILHAATVGFSTAVRFESNIAVLTGVASIITAVAFVLPNLIYFEKRRYLFDQSAVVCTEASFKGNVQTTVYKATEKAAACLFITLGVLVAFSVCTYFFYEKPIEDLNQVYTTMEADLKERADSFAKKLGYSDFDEFITYDSNITDKTMIYDTYYEKTLLCCASIRGG